MLKLARFLKPYAPLALLSVLFLFVQAFSELYLPALMADIVDRGIRNGDKAVILAAGSRMLLVAFGGVIAALIVGFCSSRVAAGFTRDIRRAVFAAVEGFSNAEFDRFSTASLITRTTNDVTQLQHLVLMGMRMLFFAPVMGLGSIVMAIRTGASMSWILVAAVLLVIALIAVVFRIAMPKFRIVQKLIDRLNLVSREHLSGLMVIRAFRNESFEQNRFAKANGDLTAVNLFVNRVMTIMMPTMMLVMNGVGVLIIWIGSKQIAASSMQVGDMMAYLQYAMHAIMSFLMLSVMFIMIPRSAVSADRIAEVIGTESSVRDPESPLPMQAEAAGVVEFRSVSFRYPGADEDVLSDISFTAKPGTTTALIGPTGCGKSTLAHLIPRFYDASTGSVLVGGVDVRQLSQKELRDAIGFVPQKGVLRTGTVADNIRSGKPGAGDAEVAEAARIAQASDFIEKLEAGYDAPVSEGGSNFSGGQKQRISIARAVVKKPAVYIFDDSFSALDAATDAKLRAALVPATRSSTVIVVSQRIHTIMHADCILVLDDGRIVGRGTHEELLESCGMYREIALSQLAAEVSK